MTVQRLTEQLRLVFIAAEDAQASATAGDAESVVAKREPERPAVIGSLMEAVCVVSVTLLMDLCDEGGTSLMVAARGIPP